MVLSWVLYALLISLLLHLGARAAEAGLRLYRRQARGVWVTALTLSVALPAVLQRVWLASGRSPLPSGSGEGALAMTRLPALLATVTGASGTGPGIVHHLETAFLWAWPAGSLCVVAWLLLSHRSLRRMEGSWHRIEEAEGEVYRADDFGPAVVGLLEPRIVLPRWALELAPRQRDLVLLHEREHVRGYDPHLVFTGWCLVAAVPWMLPVWWGFRRLQKTVELDCDLRVIRRTGARKPYGRVLLAAGRRNATSLSGLGPAPSALGGGGSFLRERIEDLVRGVPSRRRLRAAGSSLVLGGTVVLALLVQPPGTRAAPPSASPAGTSSPAAHPSGPAREDLRERLQASRYDVRPLPRNPEAVVRELRARGASLRARGIDGVARLAVRVDAGGEVQEVRVVGSSGHAAVDSVAVAVARGMEFEPAQLDGRPTEGWVLQPLGVRSP